MPIKMAGLITQSLYRKIRLLNSSRLSYVYAALFHRSPYLNVEGVPVKMPSLSPTMMEGTIVKWVKKEGDTISAGDVLCDIQTDKAVVAMDTEEEGILAKILVPEDTKDVKIGTLIAFLAPEGEEDWQSVTIPAVEGVTQTEAVPVAATGSASAATSATAPEYGKYGPSVRLLLEQYGLTSSDVPHGGPHGILVKGDVLKLIKEKNLQPKLLAPVSPPETPKPAVTVPLTTTAPPPKAVPGVSEDGYQDIEITNIRRIIAKRLTQSKSGIAHSYGTLECRSDKLIALRKQCKQDGINVSINDILIKAVAVALTICPEMNCVWQGDQLVMANEVDVSIAVATPAGLITPIIRGAEGIGIEDIATQVRDLANRARENKLKPEEFQGGTFTISNLGMFGISEFSAIINPPQCGILAVGGSRMSFDESGQPLPYMSATLSYDRAGVDDGTAAQFLNTLKSILENPITMMVGAHATVDHPMAALL